MHKARLVKQNHRLETDLKMMVAESTKERIWLVPLLGHKTKCHRMLRTSEPKALRILFVESIAYHILWCFSSKTRATHSTRPNNSQHSKIKLRWREETFLKKYLKEVWLLLLYCVESIWQKWKRYFFTVSAWLSSSTELKVP